MSQRSPGATSLPLQFREASQGAEIWPGSQNAGPAGWVDQQGPETLREIFSSRDLFLASKNVLFALRNGPAGQFPYTGSASGGQLMTEAPVRLQPTVVDASPFFRRRMSLISTTLVKKASPMYRKLASALCPAS